MRCRVVKLTETESRMVAGDGEAETRKLWCNGWRVPVQEDENVP